MNLSHNIGFIAVASDITSVKPEEIAKEIQAELLQNGAVKLSDKDTKQNIPVLFLVLTGGTEQKILDLYSERKKIVKNEPIILLAHRSNNSLPAALEVLAKFQQEGEKGRIIYLDENSDGEWRNELKKIIKHIIVYHQLLKTRIGLIGEPSDWLVASSPDPGIIRNVWGADVEQIDIKKFIESIGGIKDEEVKDNYDNLIGKASAVKEPSDEEILHVVKVYAALKKLVASHDISALTVRCFDLVVDLKTTGCYALSKLNDDGITAGCEGDLVSALGMVWMKYLTGKTAWMANPAQLNERDNSIWIAHCTVPGCMIEKYELRSHFESGIGVGIQGEFSKGNVTLLRLRGKNLDKAWIAEGEIVECGNDENLCRTQVHIKLHDPAKPSDLLNTPLGNHLLMVKGNYAVEMREWMNLFIKNV